MEIFLLPSDFHHGAVAPFDPATRETVAKRFGRDGLGKFLGQFFIAATGTQEEFHIDFLVREQAGL